MPSNSLAPVLVNGVWRSSQARGEFRACDPQTGQLLSQRFPVSHWDDCDEALAAAESIAAQLSAQPLALANFLDQYAGRLEQAAGELAEVAAQETGLPLTPRLHAVEIPRTVNQLRQAAAASRDGSWAMATVDTKANLRSYYTALGGPVVTIGPNNFPFAFNGASGGDFAAAIAAGNPVIIKAHPSHPHTTQRLAELAFLASQACQLPGATIQLIYRTHHEDGARLVSDPRVGATGFTGGRSSGLALKAAADRAGKPIYLEMSSLNPVVIFPEALRERCPEVADEFVGSCLLGSGQFCTNPGLIVLIAGSESETFIDLVRAKFLAAGSGTLLGTTVQDNLVASISGLVDAGAERLCGGRPIPGPRVAVENTLLRIGGRAFLKNPTRFQAEMFGAASLLVVAESPEVAISVLQSLDGNLTGTIYTAQHSADETEYERFARAMRPRVGRLLNNKMPTGVAVSPAMNHGGPYPSTGHPGFTAVGIPAAIRRFAMLQAFDNVPEQRLPPLLRNRNPGTAWRSIDGVWTQADVEAPGT